MADNIKFMETGVFFEAHYNDARELVADIGRLYRNDPSTSLSDPGFQAVCDRASEAVRLAQLACSAAAKPRAASGLTGFVDDILAFRDQLAGAQAPLFTDMAQRITGLMDTYRQAAAIENEAEQLAHGRHMLLGIMNLLMASVFNQYRWVCEDPRQVQAFYTTNLETVPIDDASRSILLDAQTSLMGWCTSEKASMLVDLVLEHKPRTIVEIGVFGGRSLIPQAVAARANGFGTVYGIETWSPEHATEFRSDIANDFWWLTLDYGALKKSFLDFLLRTKLHDMVKVIESSSAHAHVLFDQIDFLHIDGGHSMYGCARDVVNYVSRVKPGGIIVFDDVSWPTTAPGLSIVMDTAKLLHVVEAENGSKVPGCAAFMKV